MNTNTLSRHYIIALLSYWSSRTSQHITFLLYSDRLEIITGVTRGDLLTCRHFGFFVDIKFIFTLYTLICHHKSQWLFIFRKKPPCFAVLAHNGVEKNPRSVRTTHAGSWGY